MTPGERVLYHQIHPLKLATDFLAEVVSLPLIWHGRYRPGLAVHFLAPVIGSAVVLRRDDDLERLKASAPGRHVAVEMTPAMQAVRLAGDAVTVAGAWWHRRALIALGAAIVIGGWTLGPRGGRAG
jgi:hypothetical protein